MTDETNRLTNAKWILERNLAWIAAADIKAGVVISINLAMLGGLAAAYSSATSKASATYWVSLAALVLSGLSLICTKFVVIPRVEGPWDSLIFFGPIAKKQRHEYVEKMRGVLDGELLEDCAKQIHRNAQIAQSKHLWVRRAIVCLFGSGIPWGVAMFLLVK
jgi:hypothetical protein